MVRLQCPHKALAAAAPRLSSPSVQWPLFGGFAAYFAGFAHPIPCSISPSGPYGLYWVRRTYRSGSTPCPCCWRWPHTATVGWATLGP